MNYLEDFLVTGCTFQYTIRLIGRKSLANKYYDRVSAEIYIFYSVFVWFRNWTVILCWFWKIFFWIWGWLPNNAPLKKTFPVNKINKLQWKRLDCQQITHQIMTWTFEYDIFDIILWMLSKFVKLRILNIFLLFT